MNATATLRAWWVWFLPAFLGGLVAVVEYAVDHPLGRVLADAWTILVAGVIVIRTSSTRPLRRRHRRVLLLSLVPAVILAIHLTMGPRLANWDWMYLSGVGALLVGIELSEHLGRRLTDAVRSLVDSGVLDMSTHDFREFRRMLRRKRRRYQHTWGTIVGLSVLAGWAVFASTQMLYVLAHNPAGVLFESLAAVIAGQRLGWMIAYGSAWGLLRARRTRLALVPGHPDGAVGLRPIGHFYFQQSLIAGIPAAFLAAWWFLIPAFPIYLRWRPVFLVLLIIAILIEILAFILPMRAIHRELLIRRRRLTSEASRLTPRIVTAQLALASATEGHDEIAKQLNVLLERYHAFRAIPRWPIDQSLRRWFSLNNIALFVPFISYVAGNQQLWEQIGKVLGGLKH